MSKCESGQQAESFFLDLAMKNHKNQALKNFSPAPNGFCHAELCGMKLKDKRALFCNSECAEDYEKQFRK